MAQFHRCTGFRLRQRVIRYGTQYQLAFDSAGEEIGAAWSHQGPVPCAHSARSDERHWVSKAVVRGRGDKWLGRVESRLRVTGTGSQSRRTSVLLASCSWPASGHQPVNAAGLRTAPKPRRGPPTVQRAPRQGQRQPGSLALPSTRLGPGCRRTQGSLTCINDRSVSSRYPLEMPRIADARRWGSRNDQR
jgi:hypothetical protein